MATHGYIKTNFDHYVFVQKFSNDNFIILLLYVDDMLIIGRDITKIKDLKKEMSKTFAMKDLGAAKQIIGMKSKKEQEVMVVSRKVHWEGAWEI